MTIATVIKQLAIAFENTLLIFLLTLLFSLPFGLVVYFGKVSKNKIVSCIVNIYISIMRGTPLMLQLMVVYFGPNLLFKIVVPGNWRFNATIIAFVLNYAAYFAEIYRGGIESIDKGQYEAAEILGYSKLQTFIKIILPQMIKIVLPSVTNEVITLVKDTSLASAIGMMEMFTKAKQIAVSPNTPGLATFIVAAVFYYVFNYLVAFIMKKLEMSLDYYG